MAQGNRVLKSKRVHGASADTIMNAQIFESHCAIKVKTNPDKPKVFCDRPVVVVKNIGNGLTKKVCMLHLTS